MRTWSLPFQAPLSLTLALDTRFDGFDPRNDQIWELTVSDREPYGFAVHTTYGLRAKSMRIVPGFELRGQMRHNPETFHSQVHIHTWFPNYVSATWRPFAGIEVRAEYWARASSMLAGRYTLMNLTEEPLQPGLRLYSILEAGENAMPMSPRRENGVEILAGQTANLRPVVFLEGGARSEPAPFPALGVQTTLPAGSQHAWMWAHCGVESVEQGFVRCRDIVTSTWDADVARLKLDFSDFVDVETGDPDWDAAFWAAQREAHLRFLRPQRNLKAAVPVCSRSIKDGSSSDKNAVAWEPASPAEAYLAALQILPGSAWRVQGFLEALFRLQEANGHIPVLTNFSALHEGWLYPPWVAQLTWRVYEATGQKDLLVENFRSLVTFFERWFESKHDRDEDGFPEWDHVHQAGFKSWPAFSPWYAWSQGLDISTAETVDLASFLVMDGEALIKIASAIGQDDELEDIQGRLDVLKRRVEESWKENRGYQHVDYYLHESVPGKRLGVRRGSFKLDVDQVFDPAVRVLIKVQGPEENAHNLVVRIHSRGRRGPARVEEYKFRKFQWFLDSGLATSDKPSAEIEKIEVEGLDNKFKTTLSLADYSRQDITQLLPLAAGIPSKTRAEIMVKDILLDPDNYWRANGIPSIPAGDPDYENGPNEEAGSIDMLSNHWIAEGLLRYGYRKEAAELLTNLMTPAVETLKHEHAFSARYDPDGDRRFRGTGGISGLAPFALFLKILGVELITPRKVRIHPGNPFEQPVRLRWRGMELVCESNRTIVTFPDGGVVVMTGEDVQVIEQVDEIKLPVSLS